MALTLVTPPGAEPVSLAEAKEHLRITSAREDNLITTYLKAARQYIDGKDGVLNRALITQTWDWTLDAFPKNCGESLRVPLPPLQSVTSIKYLDTQTPPVEQTWASTDYTVDAKTEPAWIAPAIGKVYPSTASVFNAITVRFVAGYGTLATDVPEPMRLAIKAAVAYFSEHRDEGSEMPGWMWYLLAPYRVPG